VKTSKRWSIWVGVFATVSVPVLAAWSQDLAWAQGVSVYAPLQSEYKLGDFAYKGPGGDGWRQVETFGNTLILVYAETVDGDQIHTRTQVDMEAFAANPEELRGDVMWLTEQSHAQQVKERSDKLVAFSRIGPVESNPAVMSYALVTRIAPDEDMFETFYVALAKDKTSYFVAKLATKDTDYRSQPYFSGFESSLASLRQPSVTDSDPVSPSKTDAVKAKDD
jgi:hypothetical protein